MQVEKGGSWKGSSRFFFFFFFFALAGPWMAAGHFTGADSKKSSLSGATKKKTRISTCSSGVLFNFLRNQMLEITAAPKHLKCCVARSHFCWKCVSSCREEGKRWQRWTWFDRRSLSLLCPFIPLSFPSPWRPHAWQPREDLLSRISRRAELPPLPMIYLSSPPHPVSPPTHTAAPPEGADDLRMCCQLLGFFLFP